VVRNWWAHNWSVELLVCDCCSWGVVQEVLSLDLLCRNVLNMVARWEEHYSQNWIVDHGIGPVFVGGGPVAE